jgi:hypothetical protein
VQEAAVVVQVQQRLTHLAATAVTAALVGLIQFQVHLLVTLAEVVAVTLAVLTVAQQMAAVAVVQATE